MSKKKVVILSGLPGSGKTYHAKKLVDKGYKRINKDDIRAMVDNGKYSRTNEKLIKALRDAMIDTALLNGNNVVVDDTNFEKSHVRQISLIAGMNDADVEEKFINTPIALCLIRDKDREKSVGVDVIEGMYKRYLSPRKSQ